MIVPNNMRKLISKVLVCCTAAGFITVTASAQTFHTTTRVNFRTGASLSAQVIKTLNAGVPVEMLDYDAENWSSVSLEGKTGYIKSEYLVQAQEPEPEQTEQPEQVAQPETAGQPEQAEPLTDSTEIIQPDAAPVQPEQPVTYRTSTRVNFRTGPSLGDTVIETLNTGVTVDMLNYDAENWSQVQLNGVIGYIKSEYLISSDAFTAVQVSPQGVELAEWAAVKSILPVYRPLQIFDVRTGTVYFVQSFSNGLHADVEPLTKADTELLKKTYGGSWKWDPRPVWVTFNGRTFAASINGMPHGGGTIADNGMNGQVCLHFLGSKTHNGNKSFEKTHQAGVMEAWNASK